MSDRIVDVARAFLLTRSRFNHAYEKFFTNELQACADGIAWTLLELFRQKVELFVFQYDHRDLGIRDAAREIFRLELVGEAAYSFEDAMGFVKWYSQLKSSIAQAIGHLYEFHDDGFSDLCDSYPLAGRELVDRALATHPTSTKPRRDGFLDEAELHEELLARRGARWQKLICRGANYVGAALEIACKHYFLHRLLVSENNLVTWTPEERKGLSFGCSGEDW
jgi:hypothetical protein